MNTMNRLAYFNFRTVMITALAMFAVGFTVNFVRANIGKLTDMPMTHCDPQTGKCVLVDVPADK